MIEIIDNHSVRTDLLSGKPILDAGCRGFRFAKWFAERHYRVIALDPLEHLNHVPRSARWIHPIEYLDYALVDHTRGRAAMVITADPEACYIDERGVFTVPSINIESISLKAQGDWDVVKLNIEGSEYGVLANWPGPIARQISVSFHEHTPQGQGEEIIAQIVEHLSQWYTPLRHEKDARYCAGENYWDSLFVLTRILA